MVKFIILPQDMINNIELVHKIISMINEKINLIMRILNLKKIFGHDKDIDTKDKYNDLVGNPNIT